MALMINNNCKLIILLDRYSIVSLKNGAKAPIINNN